MPRGFFKIKKEEIMHKKFENKNVFAVIITVFACILTAFLIFISVKSNGVCRNDSDDKSGKVQYVLVNEDEGSTFNNRNYNLGNDFVSLVNQDQKRQWGTATRDVADAGIRSGTYDIEVVIPQNFSKRLLNLKSFSPKKAGITYRVRKGQNEVTNQAIQGKVDSIIKLFNSQIVKMYFSSLVSNLRSAQIQALTMANNQGKQVVNLRTVVQKPILDMNDQYDLLFDKTSILKDTDDDYVLQQQDFIKDVQSMLDGIGQQAKDNDAEYNERLMSLQNKTKQQLAKYQAESLKQNEQLDELKKQYTLHQGAAVNTLEYFKNGSLGEVLSNEGVALNKANNDLLNQISVLHDQYDSLKDVCKALEETYGLKNDSSVEDNKDVILDNMTNDFSQKNTLAKVNDSIMKQIGTIKIYKELQRTENNELSEYWSDDDEKEYAAATKIINCFARSQEENYVENSENLIDSNEDNVTNNVSLYFKASSKGEKNTISFNSTDNMVIDEENVKGAVQAAVKEQKIDLESWNRNGNEISFILKKQSENDEDKVKNEISNDVESVGVTFKYKYVFVKGKTCNYTWKANDIEQNTGSIKDIDSENIQKVIKSAIETISTAKQIVAVYGNEDGDIQKFEENQSDNDKIVAEKGSIADATSDESIRTKAEKYAGQVASQYEKLQKEMALLSVALGEEKPADSIPNDDKNLGESVKGNGISNLQDYLENTDRILNWYQEAVKSVTQISDGDVIQKDGLNQDLKNVQKDLDSDQVKENDQSKIVENYHDLVSAIKESGNKLSSSVGKTGDITPTVKELTKAATNLQKNTKEVVSNLNSNVNDSENQAEKNVNYADSFGKVLSNARKGEKDNGKFYAFLSNPVMVSGRYSTTRKKSIVPYFMTLIGMFTAIFVGLAIDKYLPSRKVSKEEVIAVHKRAWYNLPSAAVVMAIGTCLGLFTSIMTMPSASISIQVGWTVYTLLFETLMISLVSAFARNHINLVLFSSSILLGTYVMLTPFVGVSTHEGSLARTLYRISPLQNVENGYTVLYNGGRLGFASFLCLIVLESISIICIFLAKPNKGEDDIEEQL